MDFSKRLSISYYKNIAVLNEEHKVYLVQHQESNKIFVKKKLDIFNSSVYKNLQANPIEGIPQIVELYEEDSTLTVIEEYISGETLQEKLDKCFLHEEDINCYINALCNILIKLHSLNPPIIHRDIKPSNIIITPSNEVFLIDFNAAKYFTDIKSSDTVMLGTKGYAAPEQYGFGSSTQQTDIYAIGMLLKELTSMLCTPTNKYNAIIQKCTQINPADRFMSIVELQKMLQHDFPHNGSNFQIKSWRSLIPPGFRRHKPKMMIISSIGYFLILLLCLSLEAENATVTELWVERIFCLLVILSVVFVGTNYLNIQKLFPLCQHKNRILHYLGIIMLDILFFSILTILLLLFIAIL